MCAEPIASEQLYGGGAWKNKNNSFVNHGYLTSILNEDIFLIARLLLPVINLNEGNEGKFYFRRILELTGFRLRSWFQRRIA